MQGTYYNQETNLSETCLMEAASCKSTLISKNVTVHGKRTSIRLEPEMWTAIKEIAKRERCTIHRICTIVSDKKNSGTSLTAAIRVFIMSYFRAAATEDGHIRVGHGSIVTNRYHDALQNTAQHGLSRQSYMHSPMQHAQPSQPFQTGR